MLTIIYLKKIVFKTNIILEKSQCFHRRFPVTHFLVAFSRLILESTTVSQRDARDPAVRMEEKPIAFYTSLM